MSERGGTERRDASDQRGDGDRRGGDDRRTRVPRLVRFLTFLAMLDLLALALATRFVPPDLLTLAITVGPMLVVSPVLAYWFVYKYGGAGGP
ncbi:DUF7534 family protein [Halobaculum magnesiiphilum]|uniref:Uncharacterized protein n=1 Tax=Halobaculum magnesiiphilum TaxID=1017351 RepID=A0A8T8WAV7_9EURY|nr:hypothetical protein [Halobaculum magnesiiphilum]QZP36965.1 hypothetical protein K6T50_11775 [Halobaculum magnesiiphilum]